VAYERTIDFNDPDESLARSAWGKRDASAAEKKAFGDVVTDRICRHAAEREIPFQIHTGSALVRTSRPMNVAGLVERHPKTKFVLMHMGFPWGEDLLALAFAYPNVWLDVCWAPLLSPSYFKRVLNEMIESVPDESRIMIGGDNWHAEETYGAITGSRRMIGEVLGAKVADGYFTEADARRLAPKILSQNAARLYRLPVKHL
jgi:predicted TIM-barrel fold metal-dependent hydrolase